MLIVYTLCYISSCLVLSDGAKHKKVAKSPKRAETAKLNKANTLMNAAAKNRPYSTITEYPFKSKIYILNHRHVYTESVACEEKKIKKTKTKITNLK